MASTSKCPYCGGVVRSDEQNCPHCGAANEKYVVDMPRTVFKPKTIDELKEYCAERGMPLLRMRFFIGEDYREAKAFGIYRDGRDVIVYKNKADGSRAIRYRGPDEEHAVNEIYLKLLDECHNRRIYPDGKPPEGSGSRSKKKRGSNAKTILTYVLCWILFLAFAVGIRSCGHSKDGYYSTGHGTVYYHYGSDWYYTYDDNSSGYWYEANSFPESNYTDYSLGDNWDSDWGVSDFKESSTWDAIQESERSDSSSSSDYDSWDSGGTDWDSDW